MQLLQRIESFFPALLLLLAPVRLAQMPPGLHGFRDIPPQNEPFEPHLLEWHATRYHSGCWGWLAEQESYNFSRIHPFVYNFDFLVTFCGIQWLQPNDVPDKSPCFFRVPKPQNLSGVYAHQNDGYIRMHVMSDRAPLEYLRSFVLPQFKDAKVILHVGTGDRSMSREEGKGLLDAPQVKRLVVENCRDPAVADSPKTILQPVGICTRELHGQLGDELQGALESVEDSERSRARHRELRQMAEAAAKTPWSARSDKVLICFGGGEFRPTRTALNAWADNNCTVCATCSAAHKNNNNDNNTTGSGGSEHVTVLSHSDLWRLYATHKFVVSPHGNGVDCGRTWEILILGAVPLVEWFDGARGYTDAGLKAVLLRRPEEITPENVTRWNALYTSGNQRSKLTREFWNFRGFSKPSDP